MSIHYHHRQINPWAALPVLLITAVIVPLYGWIGREAQIPLWHLVFVLILVGGLTVNFAALTVEVTEQELLLWFGLGWPRRRFARTDIVAPRLVTIPWWYGAGIKLGLKRTTYLVATGPGVAFERTSGRTIQIGSDDADGLLVALKTP